MSGCSARASEASLRAGECRADQCRAGQCSSQGWCGRRESNPHSLAASGFSCHCGFRRPLRTTPWGRSVKVWGLDYPFTVPRTSGGRCCPSSLYTFPKHRFGLGSGLPLKVSPNLSSFASPVSQRALKFCLSPPRLPFRHARVPIDDSTSERRFRRPSRQGKTQL